jgi:chromosome segregation ATPase
MGNRLAVYARYAPESVVDALKVDRYSVSLGEEEMATLESQLSQLSHHIIPPQQQQPQQMMMMIDTIPKPTKEKLESVTDSLQTSLKEFQNRVTLLESQLEQVQGECGRLEETLKQRNSEYRFLVQEYSALSESLLKRDQ